MDKHCAFSPPVSQLGSCLTPHLATFIKRHEAETAKLRRNQTSILTCRDFSPPSLAGSIMFSLHLSAHPSPSKQLLFEVEEALLALAVQGLFNALDSPFLVAPLPANLFAVVFPGSTVQGKAAPYKQLGRGGKTDLFVQPTLFSKLAV